MTREGEREGGTVASGRVDENEEGRTAVLAGCKEIHNDSGDLNSAATPVAVVGVREDGTVPTVRANIKYKTEEGRRAVLAVCKEVHHDFGALNSVITVTAATRDIDAFASNPDIDWVDKSGAVFFVQPWRS